MADRADPAPILIFGYGNPARGDDALGPRLIEALAAEQARGRLPGVDLLTDFQPQIEHVLDLRQRRRVIFVDADLSQPASTPTPPWRWLAVHPDPDIGWTSHQLDPGQLAGLLHRLYPDQQPRLQLLAIRGRDVALDADLSDTAKAGLASALAMLMEELGG
jgi:hydrogenase maturation protease